MPDSEQARKILNQEVYQWSRKSLIDNFLDALAYGHEMTNKYGYPKEMETRQWLIDAINRKKAQQSMERRRLRSSKDGLMKL